MKKTSIWIGLVLGIVGFILLFSCQPRAKGYLREFERFVERVEHNESSLSQKQWEQYDAELQVFVNRYKSEKDNLSHEDKKRVGELTARYYKARIESLGFAFLGEIGNWIAFIQGFIDEIKKDTDTYY